MNSKMIGRVLGGVLILVALALGGLQILHIYDVVPHPTSMYYYPSVGVIGLVGIILVAWGLMQKEKPKEATE